MSERFPLSVVVLAKNEAHNLRRCLDAVHWCDDLIVLDDHSTDATAQIAADCGARVLQRSFDSFAGQRNWALASGELRHEWALMLDADEVLTPALEAEIRKKLPSAADDVAAFRMCRKTVLFGEPLHRADTFPVWIMRLVRVGRVWFEDSGHGEVPCPEIDGVLATLAEPFMHHTFSRGLSEWLARHERYATREARLERDQKTQTRLRDLCSLNAPTRRLALRNLGRRTPLRPVLRFLYQYLWRLGFLDGRRGLVFCYLMASYEALIMAKKLELEAEADTLNDKRRADGATSANVAPDEDHDAVTLTESGATRSPA